MLDRGVGMTMLVMMAVVVGETKSTELKSLSTASSLVTMSLTFQTDGKNGHLCRLFPGMWILVMKVFNPLFVTKVEQEVYTGGLTDIRNGDQCVTWRLVIPLVKQWRLWKES